MDTVASQPAVLGVALVAVASPGRAPGDGDGRKRHDGRALFIGVGALGLRFLTMRLA